MRAHIYKCWKNATRQAHPVRQRYPFAGRGKNVHEGIYGINIHRATSRAGGKSTQVDKWSAGCQVIADNDDWHEFLDVCQIAREHWGNSFTYTLIDSSDIS